MLTLLFAFLPISLEFLVVGPDLTCGMVGTLTGATPASTPDATATMVDAVDGVKF